MPRFLFSLLAGASLVGGTSLRRHLSRVPICSWEAKNPVSPAAGMDLVGEHRGGRLTPPGGSRQRPGGIHPQGGDTAGSRLGPGGHQCLDPTRPSPFAAARPSGADRRCAQQPAPDGWSRDGPLRLHRPVACAELPISCGATLLGRGAIRLRVICRKKGI